VSQRAQRQTIELEDGSMESTFAGKTVLVTGANRGLGQALVEEALRRGATRVYAGTRQPFYHPDERVVPLPLDVTDDSQIQRAVGQVESLDVLINNAGMAVSDDLSDRTVLEQHLAVNLVPKASTESVAGAIFDAAQTGEDDIFPDPMSATLAESWRAGPVKQMERQNAALVAAQPIAA
jgi:NAD(P)-dependent dehydrogenase (short-subunit alcohol dehydrogenase family)